MRLLRELQRGVVSGSSQGEPLAWSSSGDMSQATLTTAQGNCQHTPIISVECAWTGTSPVGTVQLQGSVSGSAYFNVGSTVAVSGNSGTVQVSDANAGYNFFRVLYTKTSGTGTMAAAQAQAKGF